MDKFGKAMILRDVFSLRSKPEQLNWQPFKDGVEIYPLYATEEQEGVSAALLRYAPGAKISRHEHMGYEHILILSGAQSDENGDYPEGTLIISPANTSHSVKSESGCIVLAIWEKPVKFL